MIFDIDVNLMKLSYASLSIYRNDIYYLSFLFHYTSILVELNYQSIRIMQSDAYILGLNLLILRSRYVVDYNIIR